LTDSLERVALLDTAPETGLSARALGLVAMRKRRLHNELWVVGAEHTVPRGPNLGTAAAGVAAADRRKNVAINER
jgi:hypothetical protein